MTLLLDVPQVSEYVKEPWDPTMEMLFREARRRERQRRIRRSFAVAAVVLIALAAMGFSMSTVGSSATRSNATPPVVTSHDAGVLTCSGSSVVQPRTLVITCADADTFLKSTHWSSWTARGATGTTTFAMNLCTPYCAASPISYFPDSSVVLSAPVTTHQGSYFSRLSVSYRQGSAVKTFTFSWRSGVER